jgi:hypothetical protein
MDAAPKGIGCR